MTNDDTIQICGLDLPVQIGVPEAERSNWQSLQADLTLWPTRAFSDMTDDLSKTVDYDAVAKSVRTLAASRPRKLLETLAAEIAAHVIQGFSIDAVEVFLRKRVLPGVDYVSVRLKRLRCAYHREEHNP